MFIIFIIFIFSFIVFITVHPLSAFALVVR
jgi:hypothetical protein